MWLSNERLVEHTYCRFLTDDEDLTEVGARGQGRMDPCFHVEYARSDLALILPSECCSRIRDSSDQATFFQFVQFWRTSLNCEQCKINNPLTGVATRFKVRFNVLCVQRCYLSYCCLSSSSNQFGHSLLTSGSNKACSLTKLSLCRL